MVQGDVIFPPSLLSVCRKLRRPKSTAKPNLVYGGVKFVPSLLSGCRKLRRLHGSGQTKPGGGWGLVCSSSHLRLQKAEKAEEYCLLFSHVVEVG
jgi:hypothetical protein